MLGGKVLPSQHLGTSEQEIKLKEMAEEERREEEEQTEEAPERNQRRRQATRRVKCNRWAVVLNPRGVLAAGQEGPRQDAPAHPVFDPISLYRAVWVKHDAAQLHWHGFLHFKSGRFLSQVKAYLGCAWAHCEPVRDEASYVEYMSDGHDTVEGSLVEEGREVTQGHRTDWERVQAYAMGGATLRDLMEQFPEKGREINAVDRVRDLLLLYRPLVETL